MTILAKVSIVLAILAFAFSCFKSWMQGPKCTSKRRLDGKIAIVTGANTGIGKECARELSRRGAKVIMLVRSLEKGEAAANDIRGGGGEIVVEQMDLSSFRSIRECAKRLKSRLEKVDILLNNAGVMACPLTRTEDGLEMQIGTNHFGHFLLTNLLLPLLRKGCQGTRVVTVSSLAHTSGKMHWDDINFDKNISSYIPMRAYGQSKLANVLFSNELAIREAENGINSYSLHPGVVATDLWRHFTFFNYIITPFFKESTF